MLIQHLTRSQLRASVARRDNSNGCIEATPSRASLFAGRPPSTEVGVSARCAAPRSAEHSARRARPQPCLIVLMLQERSGLAQGFTVHECVATPADALPIRSCRRDECIARLANDIPGALTRRRRRSQGCIENLQGLLHQRIARFSTGADRVSRPDFRARRAAHGRHVRPGRTRCPRSNMTEGAPTTQ